MNVKNRAFSNMYLWSMRIAGYRRVVKYRKRNERVTEARTSLPKFVHLVFKGNPDYNNMDSQGAEPYLKRIKVI